MRVLVCGGRTYSDAARINAVLDKLHAEAGIDVIIEGGAKGADQLAAKWSDKPGVELERFEADWENQGGFAGPARNRRMLTEGRPDLVVAFPGGRGTADMVRQSRRAGVEVIEIARPSQTPWKKLIWDTIERRIDDHPVDGISATGQRSDTVWAEQRAFVDGLRSARLAVLNLRDATISLDALTQENARLREALRHMADLYIGVSMNDAAPAAMTVLGIVGYDKTILTAGDIRAARRALNGGTSDAE